jgi:hypothetical protein
MLANCNEYDVRRISHGQKAGGIMFRTMLVTITLFLLSIRSANASIPVEIVDDSPDKVGSLFVFALKERIRSSSLLELSFEQSRPRLQAIVATIDPWQGSSYQGQLTAYSVVITLKDSNESSRPLYLNNYVGVSRANEVGNKTYEILAGISRQADYILKYLHNKLSQGSNETRRKQREAAQNF